MRQYLTLVDDTEEEEAEESIDRFFSCLDEDSSSSSSGSDSSVKPKKRKQRKEEKPKPKAEKKVQNILQDFGSLVCLEHWTQLMLFGPIRRRERKAQAARNRKRRRRKKRKTKRRTRRPRQKKKLTSSLWNRQRRLTITVFAILFLWIQVPGIERCEHQAENGHWLAAKPGQSVGVPLVQPTPVNQKTVTEEWEVCCSSEGWSWR